MILTKRSDYGLRVTLELADNFGQGALSAEQIAQRGDLPTPFVKKLIQDLAHAHVAQSVRGRGGGYVLAKDPVEIPLLEVLNAFEDLAPVSCLRHKSEQNVPNAALCALELSTEPCATRAAWALVDRRIQKTLASITLADLLEEMAIQELPLQKQVHSV